MTDNSQPFISMDMRIAGQMAPEAPVAVWVDDRLLPGVNSVAVEWGKLPEDIEVTEEMATGNRVLRSSPGRATMDVTFRFIQPLDELAEWYNITTGPHPHAAYLDALENLYPHMSPDLRLMLSMLRDQMDLLG